MLERLFFGEQTHSCPRLPEEAICLSRQKGAERNEKRGKIT